MSTVYSIHTLKLLRGVSPKTFEEFVHNELPAIVPWQGWQFALLKSTRGECHTDYLIMGKAQDLYTRDRYFAEGDEVTLASLRHAEHFPNTMDIIDEFHTLVNGFGDIYTDYTILRQMKHPTDLSARQPPYLKTKIYSIHTLELLYDTTVEQFETFIHTQLPGTIKLPGITVSILKGNRGSRKDKYLLMLEITSEDRCDTKFLASQSPGVFMKDNCHAYSEPGNAITRFHEYVSGFNVTYTDYTVLENML